MADCLVIGGGIVGLLCALELRREGLEVTVIDAGPGRPSASWAGGGILSPLFPWRYPDSLSRLTLPARGHYQRWCEAVSELGLVPPELHDCGMFVVQPPSADADAWAARWGQAVRPSSLRDRMPGFVEDKPGYWMPDVGAVRNPQMLAGLRALATHRGVTQVQDQVVSLDVQGAAAHGASGRHYPADTLVITAGHWSARLVQQWVPTELLFPVRGQMLLYRARPGLLPAILLAEEGYLIPRRDGLILAGSTVEPHVTDMRPEVGAAQQLTKMAEALLPALRDAELVAQWAGIRPGSDRPVPVLDRLPDTRVWLATGHYRNGLVAAPESARLLARSVMAGMPAPELQDYSLLSAVSSSDSF